MSSNQGALPTLLSLCENLHKEQPDGSSSSATSLPLLVPLHHSLCQAVHLGRPQSDETVDLEGVSLEQLIDRLCPPEDAALCRDILLQGTVAKRQLATIQYLLYQPPIRNHPLQGLARVVIPWLVKGLRFVSAPEDHDDDLPRSIPPALLELLEATMDAVFAIGASGDNKAVSLEGLQNCLDACSLKEEDSEWRWTVQGRVLVRLHKWLSEKQADSAPLVLERIQNKCLQAIPSNPTSRKELVAWLRPMTNDWLPYWQSHTETTGFHPLWECLWNTYNQSDKQQPLLGLLSTTSVLCSILPSIVDEPMPSIAADNASVEKSIPFQQPAVWDLIHCCLRQGIPKKSTGGTKTDRLVSHKEFEMLRRRGLYLLRMIIPTPPPATGGKKKKKGQSQEDPRILMWKNYIQVMETLEMETEQHLIEQVWGTLAEIMDACANPPPESTMAPPMTWHWTQLLLARILTSYDQSMVRKLAIYRFLNGEAGVSIKTPTPKDEQAQTNFDANLPSTKKGKGKNKKGNNNKKAIVGAPLTMLTPAFVTDMVVLPFDSLVGTVGTNINLNPQTFDLIPLLVRFLSSYYISLEDAEKQKELLGRLWASSLVEQLSNKTIVLVWDSLAQAMAIKGELLEIDAGMLGETVTSLTHLFTTASVMGTYHDSLIGSLAVMLRHTKTKQMNPKALLHVLSLFDKVILDAKRTITTAAEGGTLSTEGMLDELNVNPIHSSLQQWLRQVGGTSSGTETTWISMVASTVAAAFVRGELLSSSQQLSGGNDEQFWEPLSGASDLEHKMARSVAYLCTLIGRSSDKESKEQTTAGELLWPAIHKGMASVPAAMVGTSWTKADVVTRSLLLLEEGCRLQVLSGMGNGDLVVDRKTQKMMPPPPNIESLLESAAKFILHHISFLVADDPNKKEMAGASRSGDAKKASVTFANLIAQITMLHEGFPSSLAIGKVVDQMLTTSLDALKSEATDQSYDFVQNTALAYAALSCGASLSGSTQIVEACRAFLQLEFRKISGMKKSQEQIGRSVFYYAKWGGMSCLLPRLVENPGSNSKEVDDFLVEFRKVAFDAVHGIPADAMLAFFRCITIAARREMSTAATDKGDSGTDGRDEVDPALIANIVDALMTLMEERNSSHDSNYMLNEFCGLIFQPGLLLQEWRRLQRDPSAAETPIRDAYRRLMSTAGNSRPRISRVVCCRVTAGWLGAAAEEGVVNTQGMGAISFRQDIIDLLFFKETKMDLTTANQTKTGNDGFDGAFELPNGIHESSVGRGYALIFFSKLPDPKQGLHPDVQKLLVQHTILGLLDKIVSKTTKKGANKLVMIGSEDYINKIRGWQALCVLSRFVTDDIIADVCKKVFQAMGEALHQQIRYFLEVFTLQIARKHPVVVGRAILKDINERDLTLQHITSVMIVAGNLIAGRYKLDFFTQYEKGAKQETVPLNQILAGIIPWLGSTQGFSRGIAQLLAHMLIPMVVDADALNKPTDADVAKGEDSNWFLISIYRFLNENQEMKRLRQKSNNFFDNYEVDKICTPEGLLTIKVDEGGDAFPVHIVDTMKQNLQEVYEETKEKDQPQWKTIENMMREQEDSDSVAGEEDDHVNFQRKIIPLDELNLALLTLKERKQRNIAGRKKQKLVVCASLIDKVPNLGGLARTSEIFAAEKLVIPDIGVTKMDNFKSLSVGAGDWIEIEECNEKNLLEFLRSYRAKGYFIVGLEQTSSSVSLEKFSFPEQPIFLLLGKEKEGIPVEFLAAVDQCLEIPQMGLIRSLNVHVSGAIAIWEHTRQRMEQK